MRQILVISHNSDDLDFTTEASLDPPALIQALNDACAFVQRRTGVQFDLERNDISNSHIISGEKRVYKARLYFKTSSARTRT